MMVKKIGRRNNNMETGLFILLAYGVSVVGLGGLGWYMWRRGDEVAKSILDTAQKVKGKVDSRKNEKGKRAELKEAEAALSDKRVRERKRIIEEAIAEAKIAKKTAENIPKKEVPMAISGARHYLGSLPDMVKNGEKVTYTTLGSLSLEDLKALKERAKRMETEETLQMLDRMRRGERIPGVEYDG